MRIDSHQHFWHYTPRDYRWISDTMAVLKQDFLPETLRSTLQRHDMQGTILVQACSDSRETQWLLEIAEKTDFVRAVTGWIDLQPLSWNSNWRRFLIRCCAASGIRFRMKFHPHSGSAIPPSTGVSGSYSSVIMCTKFW